LAFFVCQNSWDLAKNSTFVDDSQQAIPSPQKHKEQSKNSSMAAGLKKDEMASTGPVAEEPGTVREARELRRIAGLGEEAYWVGYFDDRGALCPRGTQLPAHQRRRSSRRMGAYRANESAWRELP